jgi:hypothetical protein
MDSLIKELERAAATGDPQAVQQYLRVVIRNPDIYRDIETKARWGDQNYLRLYLQLLDVKGEIDLNNLWVCPYAYQPHDFNYDRSDPLLGVFPYTLDMDYQSMMQGLIDAGEEYAVYSHLYPQFKINAYVVDVRDLELADKVQRSMESHLSENLNDYRAPWTAAAFYVLQGAAILEITKKGVHILDSHDISLPMPSARRTRQYYERARHQPDPYYPFPRRESNSLLVGQPSLRSPDSPYVIMIHMPTFRGFALGGGYGALPEEVSTDLMIHAMRYNQQVDYGYSGGHNWPEWTKGLPKSEFVGYWIAS